MRPRLYGSLAVLATLTVIAVLVTEATKGSCSIACAWQIPLVVIGVGASSTFVIVGIWAIVYELGRAALRGRQQ